MSSRDHDLVQSVAADEPAITVPASPPRRDPVEDADASFTRKRPRLDSGSNSLRAMSAEPHTPEKTATSSHEKLVEMTIRSHPPSSPVHAEGEDSNTNGLPEDTLPSQPESPIVIASSEEDAGSPPVMVIDDDDEPVGFTVQVDADDHFCQFPFTRLGNYNNMARELTQHVNTATNVDPNLVPLLSRWLEDIPDPSVDLQGFYVNKAMFWDEFANLVNKLLARRYQWMTALGAGHNNDMSRFPFGDQFDDLQVDDIFYRFFSAYLRLCSFLLLADVHVLSRPRSEEIYPLPLLSHKHIRHLNTILRQEKAPVFHLLHKDYVTDTHEMSIRLHKDFLNANGAQNLLRLADEAFHQVPITTQNIVATFGSQLLSVLGWSIFEFPGAISYHDRSEYYRGALLFFHKYSSDLYDLSRTTDAGVARDLIQYFSLLLSELCQWDKKIAAELADKFLDFRDPESPTMSFAEDLANTSHQDYGKDPASFPSLVSNAWKFKLLRKYVVKGKMDLRVMSIATMDSALVEIWREYSNIDSTCKHPVMQHLADFLLHGQVVDYIISVDSHPQLISRSGNIVGFLVVTHRWSDSQADAIWKTVSTNPDPRVVAATMTMLRSIIGLMDADDHLYLCMKLHEMPIERYTLDILRFLRDLTGKLMERSPPVVYSTKEPRARPWNVCIRMLRDTAPSRDADKNILDLHGEANEQLRALTNAIPPDERHDIYQECTQHIVNRTKEATGSVRVIYMLAAPPQSGDGFFFQQNQDLTRQILDEIPALVNKESKADPYPYQMLALRYRLELLALMICRAGPSIPSDIYQDLWDHIIGKGALSNDARNMAWTQLLQTIKVSSDNDFCKQLVFSYLPNLAPQLYTSGLFDFVANYNYPTTRQLVATEEGQTLVLQIPGADMLWSMILFSSKGTVEDRAARLLAARYVQVNDTAGVTLAEVEAAHIALVEKCMQEIRLACKALRGEALNQRSPAAMIITVSDEILREHEIRFERILLFQKLLLEYVRQKPELNRGRRADSKIDEPNVPYGDAITIKYQCGNDRQVVMMAADHTLEDLYRRLCHATGFTKVNLFAKGQRLKITEKADQKISATDFGGQLLVQRAEGAEVTRALTGPIAGSSVFETTVVKYFDELFALMDSDDTISQLLFDFLSFFPARNTFADSVISDVASSESLFPAGKFFQARYAAQALQSRLREHIRSSSLNEKFLANAIRRLDAALLNPKLISDPISSFQELQLAAVLVNVLLEFLRERPSPDMSATYFSDGHLLADRLMRILSVALETNDDAAIVQDSYAVILEASLHSRVVWQGFANSVDSPRLHKIMLLIDARQSVRGSIARKIASVCGGDLPSTCPISKGEMAGRFWGIISEILPEAVRYPEQSQQLFEIAEHVFRANDEYNRNEESLRSSLTHWSILLLKHDHREFVGREETDPVVLGFTKLLLCCILSMKSFKKPVNAGTLMEQIFKKYIFVRSTHSATSLSDTVSTSDATLPILESHTRQELYNLMLALAEDGNTYNTLLQLAGNVENDEYEPVLATISVDRSMEIRSSTGYVGLYNPRAICYMNSLLTQLFMNLNFRQFMLSLEVQEASGSQKLLLETQRLFTQMQHSFRKSTDPRSFAACVRNLEQTPIDISIQMDADEFYNLLFDQWEAQLVKEEHKHRFRSFYGGQTLNQIKSKECEHVSERAEPFFAVQCDVQGKANLHESLQAFVRGDVMEGDNKYKCESCGGKFVDAVKRTCLKEVPDNLIFHLKRFEFDLNDFSRRKIYDHFEFPPSIDISAYHVDHLSDPSKPCKEDMFDLVGVLVHTGNCENGHYYSYIRERPCPTGGTSTWVEFDDSNVGPFDPADIAQKAFGGAIDEAYGRTMKNYSAYMLFYQRRTALENDQRQWVTTTKEQALKVPVPQPLQREVDVNNDLFIREYCLFDPSHSKFVRQLHAASRTINHGTCSEDHEQETRALNIVLAHLGQIVWRQQTADTFAETVLQLRRTVLTCSMCCNVVLKALSGDEYALLNLILRNMHPKIRTQTRAFLIDCLKFFREKEPTLYGIEGTDGDIDLDSTAPMEGVLATVVKRLRDTAHETYMSTRGWDDFYLALTQVVEMGHTETAVLLNHGLLEFCLKLFSMHVHKSFKDEHYELSRIMEKRKGIMNRLIGFVSALLLRTDLRLPVIPANQVEDRQATLDRERMRFPLTQRERQILLFWSDDLKAIITLDKILELFDPTKVDYFYPGDIVKWMLDSTDVHTQMNLTKTIVEGVMLDPPFCDAYIRASLAFCQACPAVENISKVITSVSKAIASTSRAEEDRAPGGEAVLEFYAGLLKAENEVLFEQKGNYIFHHYLMVKSRVYGMPLLLHNLESVRKGTHTLLRELYGNPAEAPPETVALKWKTMRDLIAEMNTRIIYEKDAGILRSHLNPLIATCQALVQLLWFLSQSEDEEMQQYKEPNDAALIYQYQTEVEPRLRMWPVDDGTEVSEGGGFDGQSDYGSESDDADALIET
ncbi:Nn.00g040760.m01.CDS01 [Neocucurbitaria sp. VM-36]